METTRPIESPISGMRRLSASGIIHYHLDLGFFVDKKVNVRLARDGGSVYMYASTPVVPRQGLLLYPSDVRFQVPVILSPLFRWLIDQRDPA